MSDVSEAPSLASHVKNIKLPTHANELDAYLDSLFRPVLDGNLDELSDARSLAASIKGGGLNSVDNLIHDDQLNSTDRSESVDSIHNIKPNQIKKLNYKEFKQFCQLNENANLCQLIKGGESKDLKELKEQKIVSTNYQQFSPDSSVLKVQSSINTSLNSSLTINQTESFDISQNNIGNSQSNAFTNVAGMTVQYTSQNDTSQIIQQQLVHQQMIQRAFLASAVQQNLQIQQQLLKQNQALQQLLSSDSSELNSSNQSCPNSLVDLNSKLLNSTASGLDSSSTEEALQSLFPVPLLQTVPQLDLNSLSQADDKRDEGVHEHDINKKADPKKLNEKIKILSSTNKQTGSSIPPVPPPLPLSPISYGSRAKTVRIGMFFTL